MKFCVSCGAQIEDDKKFCFKCGAPVDNQQGSNTSNPAATTDKSPVQSQPDFSATPNCTCAQAGFNAQQQYNVPPQYNDPSFINNQPYYNNQPNYYNQQGYGYPQSQPQPISVGGWIGRSLIPLIPVVGTIIYIIMLFVWCGDKTKELTFRNWAKSQLIIFLVILILVILVLVFCAIIIPRSFYYYYYW